MPDHATMQLRGATVTLCTSTGKRTTTQFSNAGLASSTSACTCPRPGGPGNGDGGYGGAKALLSILRQQVEGGFALPGSRVRYDRRAVRRRGELRVAIS